MRRRVFIALLGGAAAAPPVTWARRPAGPARVGMVLANAEGDPDGQARVSAFRQALGELGWFVGRNIEIEYRWSAGVADRARAHASELVALAPDVIVANGTPALAALFRATQDIPIVFVVVVDPVGAGFVRSLARPGGNITGFSTFEPEMGGKWVELLREMHPGLRRVAVVSNPEFNSFAALVRRVETMAGRTGMAIANVAFREATDDIEAAFAAFAQGSDGGVIVLPTSINRLYRARIIALAAKHRLAAIYPFRYYAVDGGLMCYGFDSLDLFRRGATYVDRILKGADPAQLPVQAPTKFELILNLKTAKTQGIIIPPALLARADGLIE